MELTAWIRRERAALSVTDDCRGRVDDDYNSSLYVGFPTLLILASGSRIVLLHGRLNFRRCRPDEGGGGLRVRSRPVGRAAIRGS